MNLARRLGLEWNGQSAAKVSVEKSHWWEFSADSIDQTCYVNLMSVKSENQSEPTQWKNRNDRRRFRKGLRQYDHVEWNGPIYKSVERKHADVFSRGSIKIGDLWGYGQIEDDLRRDPYENSIVMNMHGLNSKNPIHKKFIEKTGVFEISEGGSIKLYDTEVVKQGQNCYCCCFSMEKNAIDIDSDTNEIFEIIDPVEFAITLRKKISNLDCFWIAPVQYRSIISTPYVNCDATPDPLKKSFHFERDKEVRILWLPAKQLPNLEEIITKPDPQIARLIRRI